MSFLGRGFNSPRLHHGKYLYFHSVNGPLVSVYLWCTLRLFLECDWIGIPGPPNVGFELLLARADPWCIRRHVQSARRREAARPRTCHGSDVHARPEFSQGQRASEGSAASLLPHSWASIRPSKRNTFRSRSGMIPGPDKQIWGGDRRPEFRSSPCTRTADSPSPGLWAALRHLQSGDHCTSAKGRVLSVAGRSLARSCRSCLYTGRKLPIRSPSDRG